VRRRIMGGRIIVSRGAFFDAETRRWDEKAGLPAGCVKLPMENAL
jgi:hypothetical protein